MIFFKYIILGSVLLIGCLSKLSYAQYGEFTTYQVQDYSIRATAMADAYSSEAYNVGSMFGNPGSLVFLQHKLSLNLDYYHNFNNNIMGERFMTPAVFGNRFYTALSFSYQHTGFQNNFVDRIFDAPRYPEPSVHYYTVHFGFAYAITPTFSLGTLIGGTYANTPNYSKFANSTSIGAFYNPSPSVSYGLVFRGLGSRIPYGVVEDLTPSRTTTLSDKLLPESLELGISFHYPPFGSDPKWTFTFANQKIFNRGGLIYKAGIELKPIHLIALRAGYLAGLDYQIPRFGLGIDMKNVQIDYALSPNSAINERFHQLGISINLNHR